MRRAVFAAAKFGVVIGLALITLAPPAFADRRHAGWHGGGRHFHGGPRVTFYAGPAFRPAPVYYPRAYYYPPPYYYPPAYYPAPTYYAPPPSYVEPPPGYYPPPQYDAPPPYYAPPEGPALAPPGG